MQSFLIFLAIIKIAAGVSLGSSCTYTFQCQKGLFCSENKCRKDSCTINNDCAEGELCIGGKVDGIIKNACFPIDSERAEKMEFCPGGGKLSFGYKGRIETCDANKQCTGKGICNPHVGVCCSKLRICPWPKSPLLEGFTHKPLICRFRGTSAVSCPAPRRPNPPSIPNPRSRETFGEKPFVGQSCSSLEGCSGGAACICSNPRECKCECPKEMGYSVSSDGKSCRRTRRRLKEKCRSDVDCGAAFSECTSGGCRCKNGFQRDGNGGCKPVAYKCVNHAEPLRFDNKLTTCIVQKMHRDSEATDVLGQDEIASVATPPSNASIALSPKRSSMASSTDTKRCPSNYYCVAVFDIPKQPNLYQGFCCPLPSPDTPICPVGNSHVSSSAPDYGCAECPFDHFCHKDSIATHKEICCPKPCVSPDDVYVDGQCYSIAYHGDSCYVAEQCIGKFAGTNGQGSIHEEIHEMECRKGICECPKGYIADNGLCKRVECSVGFKGEPIVNSLGGILKCQKSSDCSQGSMCDPFSKVCCKGINKCPISFVETGEMCKEDKCRNPNDICIVPKNSKSKICCRKED
uniref:EB domain-containing protein n=1 Tax=Panagrolaimus davidi TaxID=227884 RepID=A0A914R141_9BILA